MHLEDNWNDRFHTNGIYSYTTAIRPFIWRKTLNILKAEHVMYIYFCDILQFNYPSSVPTKPSYLHIIPLS